MNLIRRGAACVGLTLAMAGAPAVATAQEVTIAPALEADSTWTYDLELDLLISQDVEDQETSGRVVQSARVRFDAQDVDADAGTASVTAEIERLTLMWRRGDTQHEFSWRRAADDEVDAAADGGGDDGDGDAFRRMGRALTAASIAFTVDLGSGEVSGVQGLEEAAGLASPASGLDRSALGLFNPGQFGDAVEPIWSADGGAGLTVEPGTGWQTQRDVPLGPAGAYLVITDWRSTDVDDQRVAYGGSVFVEVARPEASSPETPSVRLIQQSGSVEAVWSLDHGVLEERTAVQAISAEWTLAGLSATQNQRSETSLTLVRPGRGG